MIDIKNIQGETILSVPITKECVHVEELMKSDYVELSWNSDNDEEIPVGAYIKLDDGEVYSLLEPYNPIQKNEGEFQYKPQFHAKFMSWGKVPFFMYTYDENDEITNREPDWSLTDNPANFMSAICKAIENETGANWSYAIDSSLNSSTSLSFQSVDIISAMNSIASAFETEWWVDKDSMTIHLSKAEHGEAVTLKVGGNINTPTVTEGREGYYTRFYAFGSTRNIVQEYKGSNVNNLVNKRLTLDPAKYPNGYKDIKPNLKQGEIFSKILLFDDIYPSSELAISDVRFRLMWRIDSETNDKIQIGTDESGNPIYDQYAIWYFQIPGFNFDNSTYDEEENPNGMRIPYKEPSVHFQSGSLQGMEFELIYHDERKTITSDDGISFEVKKGDFEIKFKEEDGGYIIPAITGLIPSEGDEIILFNIKMPEEYTASAYERLETAMIEEMNRLHSDQNNYQFSSNPVAFEENNPNLSIGRIVEYINSGYSYVTRVISLTTQLDYPCEQSITIGNSLIKGSTQELKEEVASANKNIDLISAINDMTSSLQQSYQRTVKQMQEGFARINDMWKFDTELEDTIYSKFNVYSLGGISALGVWRGEDEGGGGGGLIKLVYGFDDLGGTFDDATLTDTFNAYAINEIWKRASRRFTYMGTGNVVTVVNDTEAGVVVVKGITVYDWAQQPNKPTYSLAEINEVSGTYTGLTVGKAQNADYAASAGHADSADTATSAGKLTSTRTLWGRPFDGTGNVSGGLRGVTSLEASGYVSAPMVLVDDYLYAANTIETDGDIAAKGNISAEGSVTALTTSDRRLKRDFDYTVSYTDRLLALGKVCDFKYTDQARERGKGGVDDEAHTGLIYQDAKEVLPSMACEMEDGYGALNYLSPDYINTIAGAAQETARLVKSMKDEIEKLKKEITELKKGGA